MLAEIDAEVLWLALIDADWLALTEIDAGILVVRYCEHWLALTDTGEVLLTCEY